MANPAAPQHAPKSEGTGTTAADANARSNKRKRTAHACETCRQRKSRCNGERPRCDICTEQSLECYYRDAAVTSGAGDRQAIARLEARLKDVESILQNIIPERAHAGLFSPPRSLRNDISDDASSRLQDRNTYFSDTSPPRHSHELSPRAYRAPQDSVDGLGSITFADETSSGYFGRIKQSQVISHLLTPSRLHIQRSFLAEDPECSICEYQNARLERRSFSWLFTACFATRSIC
jgi:hypothetical protein